MSGMLPGVEMHRRIRAASQRLHGDGVCSAHRHHQFYQSWAEPPPPLSAGDEGAMDEAALGARRRLEEKLGYFRHSRPKFKQTKVESRDKHLARKIVPRTWLVKYYKEDHGNAIATKAIHRKGTFVLCAWKILGLFNK